MRVPTLRIISSQLILILALALVFPTVPLSRAMSTGQALDVPTARQMASQLPLMFIENMGQFPLPKGTDLADAPRFHVRGAMGGDVWLAPDAIWIKLAKPQSEKGANIRLRFVNSNPSPHIVPFERLDTRVSYFLGSVPDRWQSDVPVWKGVRYVDLYPGIDLELTGVDGQWRPRIIAQPGADLSLVRLQVEGIETMALDGDALRLVTSAGAFAVPLFQVTDSGVRGTPVVVGDEVTQPFAPADDPYPTVPQDDPSDLLYSTFLGGGSDDHSFAIAVDATGNAYVAGWTQSSDFPTTPGAYDTSYGGGSTDAFVAKLNADGTDLDYATFLGGSNEDNGYTLAVDSSGNAYVAGHTGGGFPTTIGAYDTSYNGGIDAFLAKLSSDGSDLTYATYLGGNNQECNYRGCSIAIDDAGNAYLAGDTLSSSFPTTSGAYDTSYNGGVDAFVVKLDPAGNGPSDLQYATFLGGSSDDCYGTCGIAIDGTGNAYVTGMTQSPDFPTTPGAYDTNHSGFTDVFATKVIVDGTDLDYSTFLGGNGADKGYAVVVDDAGAAYVTGETSSSDFPTTPGAFDTSHNGSDDAFVVKVNTDGTDLGYATFLGGTDNDRGYGIAIVGGSAYVTGETESSGFPTTTDAYDTSHNGGFDAFVAIVNANGTDLDYATFLGGTSDECTYYDSSAIAAAGGSAYVTGDTGSSDFPTTAGAYDTSHNGGTDVFISKLTVLDLAPPTLFPIDNSDGDGNYLVDWSDVTGATGYTLEEDDNPSFASPTVLYSGTNSQYSITNQPVDTWCYRVKACNEGGCSAWSNVESVAVINGMPTASIDVISPNPAIRGVDTIQFQGSGFDNDEGGASIVAYHWHSSLNGDLSSEASFSIPAADLSVGNHTISFQVMDNEDTWSEVVTETLIVQDPSSPPTAYIDSITPNPATQGHDTVTFVGHGLDSDESGASIVAYEWSSDLDGFLSDQASFSQAASDLALGLHTIGFRVQDDEGEWSSQVTTTLTIEPEVGTSWTMMLYFDGDNNLSIELNNALQRLEQSIAANPYINLLVLFDRDGTNNTYRYLVQPGGVYQDGVNRWYLGELNMGAQQTLVDFVTWSMQNYPADHTYLSIVDHGRGAHGIAKDNSSGGDSLETQELRAALSTATNAGTSKVDVVQYDACSMGLLENAYQIREYADYLVVSQNIVWGAFAYDSYLDGITGATMPEDLALQIASAYHNHSGVSGKPHTVSVLDLSQAESAKGAADTLASALRTAMVTPPVPTHVQNARNATQKFDSGNQNSWYRIDPYDEYVDLYHFADRVKAYVPDSGVDAAADAVMAAVSTDGTGLVLGQYHRSGYYTDPEGIQIYWDLDNAHGVSIFFPQASSSQDYTRYMSHVAFVFTGATQWDEFLSDYWGLLGLPPEPGNDGGYGETLPAGHRVFLPLVLKSP